MEPWSRSMIQTRTGPFSDSLALSRPASMTKILAQAEKHVEVEEDKKDRLQVERELLGGLSSSTAQHYTSHGVTARSFLGGMVQVSSSSWPYNKGM
ncbi:hypothetical protein CR513_04951, partial [Mucuna pruriens]